MLRWNTTGITVAGITGSSGTNSSQLNFPFGIMLDYANNLYIADYDNQRIQKYFVGSSTGETLAGNTTIGSSQSLLYNPPYVIMDANGNFYITDKANHRILYWLDGAISGTTVAGITDKEN